MANILSRAERIKQAADIIDAATGAMTTYQVTQKMGLAYSNHSRQIVLDAWRNNLVSSCRGEKGNGLAVFYFWSKKIDMPRQIALGL